MKKKLTIFLATAMLMVTMIGGEVFAGGNIADTEFDFTLSPTSSAADYDVTSKRAKYQDNKVYMRVTSVHSAATSVAWVQGSTKSAPTTFKNCAANKNYNLSKKGTYYLTNNVIGRDCYYARVAVKGRVGTGYNRIKGVWSPDNSSGI